MDRAWVVHHVPCMCSLFFYMISHVLLIDWFTFVTKQLNFIYLLEDSINSIWTLSFSIFFFFWNFNAHLESVYATFSFSLSFFGGFGGCEVNDSVKVFSTTVLALTILHFSLFKSFDLLCLDFSVLPSIISLLFLHILLLTTYHSVRSSKCVVLTIFKLLHIWGESWSAKNLDENCRCPVATIQAVLPMPG